MSMYETNAQSFNLALSQELKKRKEFEMPEWATYVKTGVSRERPPSEEDFWHKRAASILRQLYIHKIVGVNRLRTRYGGRQNRGVKPEKFRKASGKIIRTILQQAEKAGLVEKAKGKKVGRKLTLEGKNFLDDLSKK